MQGLPRFEAADGDMNGIMSKFYLGIISFSQFWDIIERQKERLTQGESIGSHKPAA